MGSAVPAIKLAVYNLCSGLYSAPTLVTYGDPGSNQPAEIVSVMAAKIVISRPVASTARTREEEVALSVLFSVWAPGTESQQQVATERAFALLAPFVDYFKTKPNETLGGACREAWVSDYELTEFTAYEQAGAPTGRVSEVLATLTAKTRI